MKYGFSLAFFLFFSSAWGQSFQPVNLPMGLAQKIVVRGFKGTLQIVPSNADQIRVSGKKVGGTRFDQWKFQVRKKQDLIEVLVKGPSDSEDWEKQRSGQVPSFDLTVMAPPRPLEVYWAQGKVTAKDWKSDISVQTTQGEVSLVNGIGNLQSQVIRGKLTVTNHKGNVSVQTYKGQCVLGDIEGLVKVNNHSAIYNLSNIKGNMEVSNHSGSMTYKKGKGQVNLHNISGALKLSEFQGSVEGETQKGSIQVDADELQSFVINSTSAPVVLKVGKKSGAQVLLRSEKGHMRVPPHLQKLRKGAWTEYRGRLKGDKQGQIKIISKYGNIVLK